MREQPNLGSPDLTTRDIQTSIEKYPNGASYIQFISPARGRLTVIWGDNGPLITSSGSVLNFAKLTPFEQKVIIKAFEEMGQKDLH